MPMMFGMSCHFKTISSYEWYFLLQLCTCAVIFPSLFVYVDFVASCWCTFYLFSYLFILCSGITVVSCRLHRLLRDIYNHTVELFRFLFYQPRFMSSEIEHIWKSAMADARDYIYTKLCGFDNYSEMVAGSSICSSSYPFCMKYEHSKFTYN